MLAVALQADVSAYIDALPRRSMRKVTGWWPATVITTNEVITAAGPVPARAPRVNDKRPIRPEGVETVRFGDPARVGTQAPTAR